MHIPVEDLYDPCVIMHKKILSKAFLIHTLDFPIISGRTKTMLGMQPDLYRSFAKETSFLEQHFGYLGESGSYILGDDNHGLQWHIYIVSDTSINSKDLIPKPTYTLEVCMTELCPAKVNPSHTQFEFEIMIKTKFEIWDFAMI